MAFSAIFSGVNLSMMFNIAAKLSSKVAQKKNLNFAQLVLKESQILVPKDTLALMRSGKIRTVGGKDIFITYNTSYAMRVHEDMMMKHTAPTSAKYLEIPARIHFGDIDIFFGDFGVDVGLT